jgi:hypothetical protein
MLAISVIFLLATLVPSSSALAPPPTRRAFISEVATSATIATTSFVVAGSATPAFAEKYSLDTGAAVEVQSTIKDKKKNDGGKIVGGALAAGSLLSLPFFLPNLLRLAGVRNAKNPNVVAATSTKKGSAATPVKKTKNTVVPAATTTSKKATGAAVPAKKGVTPSTAKSVPLKKGAAVTPVGKKAVSGASTKKSGATNASIPPPKKKNIFGL